MNTRIEKDAMGAVGVPEEAEYGAQTERALRNFQIGHLRFPGPFLRAIGLIKQAAAEINTDLGLLPIEIGQAIAGASRRVAAGEFDDQFVVEIFQTGSGTSTNMNANEVIASVANQALRGGPKGGKSPVHPNDAVNLGQSSNDVIPTALHVSALEQIERKLIPALLDLEAVLVERAGAFDVVVKIGRTHLQDAVPIRLGQEFSGFASQVSQGVRRVRQITPALGELAIGGTAVGTGLNTTADFGLRMAEALSNATGLAFRPAPNPFEALANRDAAVEASGALKTVAVSLSNIANNLRWLASGPRRGIGEIRLPELQPGSSIMPGKVNPVIPEAVMMAAAQVVGNDATITWANALGSNFQLNVMAPVIAFNLLQSIDLLAEAAGHLARKCLDARDFLEGRAEAGVRQVEADEARCRESIEQSLALCTVLAPRIGYDNAAAIAKAAYHQGRTVREVAESLVGLAEEEVSVALGPPSSITVLKDHGGFPTMEELSRLLDPLGQTIPGAGSSQPTGG